jgi:hypothetical protein
MKPGSRLSILSNIKAADLKLDPYPHLVIENALDSEVFDYPACKVVTDERVAVLWRQFFAYHTSREFFLELVKLAGDTMRTMYPDLERRIGLPLEDFKVGMRPGGRGDPLAPGADVSMECQFYVNYTRAPRTVRGPHVDRPSELFAALLYFRQEGDDSKGADLDVCEAVEPIYPDSRSVRITKLPAEVASGAVRTVRTAAYRANTLVLFLNSSRSIHAVSPRTATPLTRRHINFCADVPFDLFELKPPLRLAIKKSLEAMPVLWRVGQRM